MDCESEIRRLEKQILDLEKLMDVRFEANNNAVDSAYVAMQARFESVNEFRKTLSDQTRDFVTRQVFDAFVGRTSERLGSAESRLASNEGRIVGYSAGMGLVVLILAIVAQVVGLGG